MSQSQKSKTLWNFSAHSCTTDETTPGAVSSHPLQMESEFNLTQVF